MLYTHAHVVPVSVAHACVSNVCQAEVQLQLSCVFVHPSQSLFKISSFRLANDGLTAVLSPG